MLKKLSFLIVSLFLVGFLFGCAATTDGAEYISDNVRLAKLLETKADKRDVYYAVGQPIYIRQVDKKTVWTYMRAESKMSANSFVPIVNWYASGGDYKVNIKEFEFDDSNSLKSIQNDDFQVTTVSIDLVNFFTDKVKRQIDADVGYVRDEMKKFNLPFDERTLRSVLFVEKSIRHQQAMDKSRSKK